MENVFEVSGEVVLTPMQYVALTNGLKEKELKVMEAEDDLRVYRLSEAKHVGDEHFTSGDEEFKKALHDATNEVSTYHELLSNPIIASPVGDSVQIGSLVNVTINNRIHKEFVVVLRSLNAGHKAVNEVSLESPIGMAIFNKEEGYSGKYAANGNVISVSIDSVNNDFCAEYMEMNASYFENVNQKGLSM